MSYLMTCYHIVYLNGNYKGDDTTGKTCRESHEIRRRKNIEWLRADHDAFSHSYVSARANIRRKKLPGTFLSPGWS